MSSGIGRLKLKGHGVVGAPSTGPASSGAATASTALSGAKRSRADFESSTASSSSTSSSSSAARPPAPAMTGPQRNKGAGMVTTSGTAVMGKDTRFKSEVAIGDAIEVLHPKTCVPEVRLVKMVLSDISLGIGSAFGSDLSAPTAFHVLKLPKAIKSEEEKAAEAKRKKEEEERAAYGRYGGSGADGNTFTYREKKGESYRIKTVTTEKELTREEMLDLRSKQRGDKFC